MRIIRISFTVPSMILMFSFNSSLKKMRKTVIMNEHGTLPRKKYQTVSKNSQPVKNSTNRMLFFYQTTITLKSSQRTKSSKKVPKKQRLFLSIIPKKINQRINQKIPFSNSIFPLVKIQSNCLKKENSFLNNLFFQIYLLRI